MRVLLDENVPIQALDLLERVLRGHDIEHVDRLGWSGKKDRFLLPDAANAGFELLVTKDSNQLSDPDECRLIKSSGMHHVRFRQGDGVRGLGAAIASVVIAMPQVVDELAQVAGQRLVQIHGINPTRRRHDTVDPAHDPPPYW